MPALDINLVLSHQYLPFTPFRSTTKPLLPRKLVAFIRSMIRGIAEKAGITPDLRKIEESLQVNLILLLTSEGLK